MKSISTILLIVVILGRVQAQPSDWTVEAGNFDNSMIVVGTAFIDGTEIRADQDWIAAYENGNVCGIGKFEYQEAVDRYLAFLIIYSNSTSADISFEYYSAAEDSIISLVDTVSFEVNGLIGDGASPWIWSDRVLSSEAEILAFSVPGAYASNIEDDLISLQVLAHTDLSSFIPEFEVSPGAKVYVGDSLQESGKTSHDFSEPVTYRVLAENGQATKTYTVSTETIVLGNREDILKLRVYPNPVSEELSFHFRDQRTLNAVIYTTAGSILTEQTVSNSRINVAELAPGIYLLHLSAEDGREWMTRFIKN